MIKLIYTISSTAIITYIIIGILLSLFQRKLIYFPTEKTNHSFQQETLHSNNEELIIIKVDNTEDKKSTSAILYFGGNAESVANTAYDFSDKITTQVMFLVNYRGYGGSSGSPKEKHLYMDALNIYDSLSLKYEDIYVIGRSLGSGVATYLASKRPVKKLALITPFDSIKNIAQKKIPYYPMSILLKDKFDSIHRAKEISAPTLILSAENDELITQDHTDALEKAFKNTLVQSIVIPSSKHNTISHYKLYHESINKFLM